MASNQTSDAPHQAATLVVDRLPHVMSSAQLAVTSAILLNGGGAVAVITFAESITQHGSAHPALYRLPEILFILIVGTVTAAGVAGLSFLAQYSYFTGSGDSVRMGRTLTRANSLFVALSYVLFSVAAFMAYSVFNEIATDALPLAAQAPRPALDSRPNSDSAATVKLIVTKVASSGEQTPLSTLLSVSTLIPLALGAAVGWYANWFYYRRARIDSQQSHQELINNHLEVKHNFSVLVSALEKVGYAKVVRDSQGNIIDDRTIVIDTPTGTIQLVGYPPTVSVSNDPPTA
jgi:hypothetical protein